MIHSRRWEEIQASFDQLVEMEPSERAGRLTLLASSDPELHQALESLLAADAAASAQLASLDNAFDSPIAVPPDPFGLVGQTISHFRVLEPLGAGGMGIVYRAEDMRLRRPVALKFLLPHYGDDATAKTRFVREARAAAALDHPNLCTVLEVGESEEGGLFIAMVIYAGETLKARLEREGPLSVADCLAIARQVLEGLSCAHATGIVHRDLKPGNIMLLPDGTAKILDFGLAKARDDTASVTSARMGTAAYMSPEQINGDVVDSRADLWALGAVLYEMLTGRKPFRGDNDVAIAHAIFHDQPLPLLTPAADMPVDVQNVLLKLLQKDPAKRYAAAADVLADLRPIGSIAEDRARSRWSRWQLAKNIAAHHRRSVTLLSAVLVVGAAGFTTMSLRSHRSATATAHTAIAVLPLENFTGDPAQQNFVDAMHDAIIAELAQIRALTVLSRQSVLRFRNTEKSIPEIARDLNVDDLVQGSVFRAGDTVRITVRLVQARPAERHLWAQSFERDLRGVLSLQGQVARTIAERIEVEVTPDELKRLARARPVNTAAYQAWLRGWATMSRSSTLSVQRCIAHAEEAAAIDSGYAPAYALAAFCYNNLTYVAPTPPQVAFPKAKAAAQRAIQIDPSVGAAHVALAMALCLYDWDWSGADREFRRAIELAPSEGGSHWWYSFFLASMGRHDEALEHARRAELLSPGAPGERQNVAMVLYLARRYDEAIDQAQRTIDLAPEFGFTYDRLANAYEGKKMYNEAVKAWEKALALTGGGDRYRRAFLARSYALAGRRNEARRMLAELLKLRETSYVAPTAIAHIYLGLGQFDQAMMWLEKGYDERDGDMPLLKTWPLLDPLRSDPRFQRLLARMHFPT